MSRDSGWGMRGSGKKYHFWQDHHAPCGKFSEWFMYGNNKPAADETCSKCLAWARNRKYL